ncbi:MAG: aspartyl protease family protein [Aggregatilineales bacterium]
MKPKINRLKHRIARAYNRMNYLYFVQVRLIHQGMPLDLLLLFDTGATHTGIRRASFDYLGIPEEKENLPTFTATGPTYLPYGIVDSLVLDGEVVMEKVRVTILPDQFFDGYHNAGGILGGSFLSRMGFFMGNGVIDVFYEPKPSGV